jgi:hypothetical protein
VEGVAAVLDANVEQGQGEHRDIGIAVIDVLHNGDSSLAWSIALFGVDQVGDFEIQRQIGLKVLRIASIV